MMGSWPLERGTFPSVGDIKLQKQTRQTQDMSASSLASESKTVVVAMYASLKGGHSEVLQSLCGMHIL